MENYDYLLPRACACCNVLCSHGQKEAKRQIKMLQERLESVKTELTDKSVHQSELELQTRHVHNVTVFHRIEPRNSYSTAKTTHVTYDCSFKVKFVSVVSF